MGSGGACGIFSIGLVAEPTCADPRPSLNPAAVEIGSGEAASQRADVALSTTGGGDRGIDSSKRLGQEGPLKLHLRPSRNHIVGDLEEPGTASASLSGVAPRSDGRGEAAGEGSSEPEGAVGVTAFFSLAASYPFGGGTSACRGRWSASRSEARRGAARDS